jgi:cell division protein FtsI/penicillin-binding protein 2
MRDELQGERRQRFAAMRASLEGVLILGALLVVPHSASQPRGSVSRGIFSQAAQANLDRNFPSPEISYLLMDVSGSVVAVRWPAGLDPDSSIASSTFSLSKAIAPGSLVKPFLAIAYGEQRSGKFPIVRCTGTSSHCWLPSGHGSLGLEEAIVQSCNTYFLELAAGLDRGRAMQTFARYGLAGPDVQAPAEALIGLGSGWKESPLALAKAYLQLEKEQQHPVQSRIVMGMLGSAERGTARAVDAELGSNVALAKTGTAPCSHKPAGAADGFTVVLVPAVQPRLLLLVRVHGETGAASAKVAGAMLRSLGESSR